MKVLVVGGTGNVGCQTADVLLAKGVSVRCLTRSPEKLVGLPSAIEGRVGDLTDPTSLPACFEGCDEALMVLAMSPSEEEQGRNAVKAAVDAGMTKIVYISVIQPRGSDHIPHFASKLPIEQAVRNSGIPFVILRPNSFFQNELLLRVPLTEFGVFPTPFGHKGANRIDVRDIADAAVAALTGSDFDGGTFDLHGPESLTGPQMAAIWARHLGRPMEYTGDDIEGWEESVRPLLPSWLTRDLRVMYDFVLREGFAAPGSEVEQTRTIVGHDLRTYDAFVGELARSWGAS